MAVEIQKKLLLLGGIFILLFAAGCHKKPVNETPEQQEQEIDKNSVVEDTQLYSLLYINTDAKKLFVENVESGRKEEYEYNGGTYIRNRYGDSTIIEELQVGELVYIKYTNKKVLTEVNMASDTFFYDSISNFSIDAENNMITVADSKYHYDVSLKVFSENGIIPLSEVSHKSDTICIRGKGKEIFTVVVTQGHGTVRLKNTNVFVGGMITIGNVVATEIKADMELEVPEGTYTLSAANDGYGGTMEITVKRNENVTVDLNIIKGNGPSYCMLKITATPSEAKVSLGGAVVDYSNPIKLEYGVYPLRAWADGYEAWSGKLVVSSSEAEILITLEEMIEEDKEDKEEKEDKEDDSEPEDKEDKDDTEQSEDTKKEET